MVTVTILKDIFWAMFRVLQMCRFLHFFYCMILFPRSCVLYLKWKVKEGLCSFFQGYLPSGAIISSSFLIMKFSMFGMITFTPSCEQSTSSLSVFPFFNFWIVGKLIKTASPSAFCGLFWISTSMSTFDQSGSSV